MQKGICSLASDYIFVQTSVTVPLKLYAKFDTQHN